MCATIQSTGAMTATLRCDYPDMGAFVDANLIEPVFAPEHRRTRGKRRAASFLLHDFAERLWREQSGRSDAIPDALVTAATLPIEAHLAMWAALQVFIGNSISVTINVPAETAFSDFAPIYRLAWDKGMKGCATFRPTAARDTVLPEKHKAEPPCPSVDGCKMGETVHTGEQPMTDEHPDRQDRPGWHTAAPLPVEQLYQSADLGGLDFETTADLAPFPG